MRQCGLDDRGILFRRQFQAVCQSLFRYRRSVSCCVLFRRVAETKAFAETKTVIYCWDVVIPSVPCLALGETHADRQRPSRFLLEPLPAAPALLTSMDGGNAEDCLEQSRPPSRAVGRIGSLPIATLPPSMAVVKPGRSNWQRSRLTALTNQPA
jgi:hypothetical protein